ncbi:uncharacterized protein LOC134540677 [Bacillus rossius redtenbacheri]|uniref:uncharacterized protein LOC134540677 n=1 Tax=Bacillus rossius redtenbacheri TaxID=93214 RepID=UPI002FDEC166
MENATLVMQGSLSEWNILNRIYGLLTPNATAWSQEKVREIVNICKMRSEQNLYGVATNCSSGASDWAKCLHLQMIVECPDEYWNHSDQCNSLKEYLVTCPNGPPPPPPQGVCVLYSPTPNIPILGLIRNGLKKTVMHLTRNMPQEAGDYISGSVHR